ncbi:MAG: MFS transporter [Acetobacteraceae bacterium]|nr:MFS transporter [Acetobacteraceae bacterium]
MRTAVSGVARRSLRGLDFVNFFIADVQTGFGPFVAVYLTAHKWTEVQIGLALTLGTIASVMSQVPSGAIVDTMANKRLAAGVSILSVILAAIGLALFPSPLPVYAAEVLHGFGSSVLVPAIAALSLQLVGHTRLPERLGRNAAFASAGNGIAAGIMGGIGTCVGCNSVFWLTAALGVPALVALWLIRPAESVLAARTAPGVDWRGLRTLFMDRRLILFGACVAMFHLSNAAMLPIAAAQVTERTAEYANLIIAACIVVPQAVVTLISPWVGGRANRWGRRPLMLLGWGALPVRGLLLAFLPGPYLLIAGQSISGISAAVFGVMLPLVAADLTKRNGHFNLCLGALGLCVFGGAAVSTTLAGWIADEASDRLAFMALAAIGLVGTLLIWLLMPETRDTMPEMVPAGRRSRSRAVCSQPAE